MGPRPPRPGSSALAAKPAAPVEVVRVRSRRAVELPSAPLPATVTAVLAAIVRDMRDVPRDCLVDRAELVHWLRRMAGRVEGVGRMRMPAALPRPLQPTALPSARPATSRDLAKVVFGKGPSSTKAPKPRTIVSRRGHAVRVEVRRVRAAEQMELGL